MVRERIKNTLAPCALLVAVLAILHLMLNYQTGDYVEFYPVFDNYNNVFEWMSHRYETWASRVLIEAVLIPAIRRPLLWAVLDVGAFVLIYYSLIFIFNQHDNRLFSWSVALTLLCYPLADLSTAGWIPTTVNYLWPLAAGVFSFAVVIEYERGKSIPKWLWVVAFLATVFACNQEQACVIAFGLLLVYIIWKLVQRQRISPAVFVLLLISIVSLVFELTCPGNSVRKEANTLYWWPDFANLSIMAKTAFGCETTLDRFLFLTSPLMLLLACCLLPLVAKNKHRAICLFVAGVPIVLMLLAGPLSPLCQAAFPHLWESAFSGGSMSLGNEHIDKATLLVELLMLAALTFTVIIAFSTNKKVLLVSFFVLGAGFASRVIMGFSPTMLASSTRTFIFFDFALLSLSLLCCLRYTEKGRGCYCAAIATVATLNMMNVFLNCV